MSTIGRRLEDAARNWLRGGQRPEALWSGWDYLVGYCWLYGGSGVAAGLSQDVYDFVKASQRAMGSGYDALLATRESCDGCGVTYRLENLSVCTDCKRTRCPGCAETRDCPCGGELVG